LSSNVLFLQDDLFTSFRYIKNFINGNGLVYNTGEYVEGYTNFLWVMLLTLPAILNFDIVPLSQILSISFAVALFPVSLLISEQIKVEKEKSIIPTLFNCIPLFLLALTGGVQYWSVSGMETSLFSFLILLSTLSFIKGINKTQTDNSFVYFLVMASFTRPEGLVFFIIFMTYYIFNSLKKKGYNIKLLLSEKRDISTKLIIYLIPVTIYLIFRIIYYGYPFPNTYYAKTSYELYYIERGLIYYWESLSQNMLYGIMIVIPIIWLVFDKKKLAGIFLLYLFLSYSSIIIILGGDVLPFNRFLIPILPIIYILFSKSLQFLITKSLNIINEKWQSVISILLFLLIAAFSIVGYNSELPKINDRRDVEEGLVTKMRIYAEWVNDQIKSTGKQKTVALSTIGAFSYYSDATVIDMIGLTDEYIAHNPVEIKGIAENVSVLWKERRYNAEYVLDRNPDYIIFPAGAKPSAFPESALFSRERFIKGYYLQLIYSDELKQYLPVFTKRPTIIEETKDEFYDECNLKFVGHYIIANNEFMRFVNDKSEDRFNVILSEANKMIEACPLMSSKAHATIGYTYFHNKDYANAEYHLRKSIYIDEMNALPYVYLIDLLKKTERQEEAIKLMKMLKQFSPDALPNIEFSN
jgi:arabinofuranosyltransferase